MESNAKYTLVGAFVIGAFTLIVLGVLWLSNKSIGKDFKYYTIYFRNQSLNGLQLNSAITMKGIKVGVVDQLGISEKSIELVQVTAKLDKTAPIKIDTKASITRNLLTGLAVVELSGAKQESADLIALQEGEKYPIIPEGKSDLDAVASSVPELLRDATEVLSQLKEVLKPENIKSIDATIKNVETLSTVFADNGDNISKLISKTTATVSDLQVISSNVSKFTKPGDGDLARLSQSVSSGVEELKVQLKSFGEKSSKTVEELSNSFRVVAQDVNTAATSVAQASRSFATTAEHLGDLRTIVGGPNEKNLGPGEKRAE
jgi:phospholipid/cholesterol/gamma-HCH transport system substrate-binding protein